MTFLLIRKLLRDVALSLLVVCCLLFLFEFLWGYITRRVVDEVLPGLEKMSLGTMTGERVGDLLFEGPGKILQTIIGGDDIRFYRVPDMMSVGLVHPLVQTILCIWAIGRAAGAVAGELDRGTMELLLAQPVPRWRLLWAHFCVDLVVIPLLCLSLWGGIWFGGWLMGLLHPPRLDPWRFLPGLANAGLLVYAVSGYTMWLSACSRFRGKVLGRAILFTLVMFLINVVGQLSGTFQWLRPATIFYYYQPQPLILKEDWAHRIETWWWLGTLLAVGTVGYVAAVWTFSRRDLPAPL